MSDREHSYDPADDLSLIEGGAGAGAGDAEPVDTVEAGAEPVDDESVFDTALDDPEVTESALTDAYLGETEATRGPRPVAHDAFDRSDRRT